MNNELSKKYYKIGEVAEMLGIPDSTLRYWEKQFTIIKPRRNKGTRYYTPDDVEKIRMVHFLVKERGMHLEAAQQQLRNNRDAIDRRTQALASLRDIRARIQALLDNL